MKSTLSQTFPMTEEWDWTLSSREDRKPHSPMTDLTKQSKCKSHLCPLISTLFYLTLHYRWCVKSVRTFTVTPLHINHFDSNISATKVCVWWWSNSAPKISDSKNNKSAAKCFCDHCQEKFKHLFSMRMWLIWVFNSKNNVQDLLNSCSEEHPRLCLSTASRKKQFHE